MATKIKLQPYPGLKYAKDHVSVVVVMDNRREKRNGLFPVRIQIVYHRVQRYYPTGKDLSVENWLSLPSSKSKGLISIRNDIKNSYEKVEEIVKDLVNEGDFSFNLLNLKLSSGTGETINTAFKTKIDNLKCEDRVGSQLYYIAVLNNITSYKGERIRFSDVTPDWLRLYEKHMLVQGKTYTTVGMYMRALRAIMNEAKRNGIIRENQYPFGRGKYEIPQGEGRKLALNMQQIKTIITYTDGKETTERYRDLWFFSYLCNGINFTDLLKLKYSNIVGDEISFYRQKTIRTSKTKKEIQATITPEMQDIINRWGNPDKSPDNLIFPYLSGNETPMQEKKKILDVTKRVNKRLKEIGAAVGIEGLTTYVARHSYATVLKRSGANIAYISESLGHSDLKTTENYLASFEKEERIKNATLLTLGL